MTATLTRKRRTRTSTTRSASADRVKAMLAELAYRLHTTKVVARPGRG